MYIKLVASLEMLFCAGLVKHHATESGIPKQKNDVHWKKETAANLGLKSVSGTLFKYVDNMGEIT